MMTTMHVSAALAATLALTACNTPAAPSESAAESAVIGACGANADPTTGVMCKYTFAHQTEWPTLVKSEVFERDTLDYVRCSWEVFCEAGGTAQSDTGQTCVRTIGTGCASKSESTIATTEILLPHNTDAKDKDRVCNDAYAKPSSVQKQAACKALDRTVEQYEDLCCLPRVAPPPPNPNPTPGAGSS
jgi:hypothetical protein